MTQTYYTRETLETNPEKQNAQKNIQEQSTKHGKKILQSMHNLSQSEIKKLDALLGAQFWTSIPNQSSKSKAILQPPNQKCHIPNNMQDTWM